MDRAIAELATLQYGVVAGRQLAGIGLRSTAVADRAAAGRLHRVHRGVYAVGHPLLSRRGEWIAAVLALGPGALLSHASAAALWDLTGPRGGRVDVTAPDRNGRARRPGIAVHRSRIPDPESTVHERIPVTSVARTLLDLAGTVERGALHRAYVRAERLQLLDLRALGRVLERSNGRRGRRALAALCGYDRSAAASALSELELLLLDLIRDHGLPTPQANVLVGGYLVDAYWPQEKLVVEVDGYEFHSDREAFERDHRKLGRLTLAGYQVLAVTYRQVVDEPEWVVGAIRRLLGPGVGRKTPRGPAKPGPPRTI